MAQPSTAGAVPTWDLTDRLRKAREHAGYNQTQLAEATGIGRSTIVTYETGRSVPPRHVLITWAFICGVSVDWLIGDTGGRKLQRRSERSGQPTVTKPHQPTRGSQPTHRRRPFGPPDNRPNGGVDTIRRPALLRRPPGRTARP